jgi:lipid-binding SYLF domain-containing protein
MKLHFWSVAFAALLASSVGVAARDDKLAERASDAATVLQELRSAPDKGIPEDLWTKAECVAVIPGVKKAAFIFGGEYGKGLVSCRDKATRKWSPPAFLLLGKGSVGFQIGAESVDLVLLVMNEKGMHRLLEDKVALGGEASVAGGPLGRDARAMTDAQLKAEMLSYSRAQGIFAGVDVSGGVLKPDNDDNRDLYRRKISAREILLDRTVRPAAATEAFMRELERSTVAANSNGR